MSTRIVYCDSESTGLDPDRHEMWELAIIDGDDEWEWQLPVDLARADPMGLRVGRFYERRAQVAAEKVAGKAYLPGSNGPPMASLCRWRRNGDEWIADPAHRLAEQVARLLDGAHVAGMVPWFDLGHGGFVSRWLRAHGQQNTAHYHLVDVEAVAVGWLHARGERVALPWRSDDLSRACGVEPPGGDERHTALGDARWARRLYEHLTDAGGG